VGIRSVDGTTIMHPPQTTTLSIGDVVVILGYNDDIPHFAARPPALRSPKTTTYRGVTTTA
jgi:hypothetical protein